MIWNARKLRNLSCIRTIAIRLILIIINENSDKRFKRKIHFVCFLDSNFFLFFFFFVFLVRLFFWSGVEAIDCNLEPKNNEGRLRKDLFCNYDRDNRPILADGPITIRIKMIVKGFTFSDDQGTLSVATWLAMVRFSIACACVFEIDCLKANLINSRAGPMIIWNGMQRSIIIWRQ